MKLKAIVHRAEEGGYWAEVPSLPGCVTQAESLSELQGNLKEAIEGWLSIDGEQQEARAGDEIIEIAV